MSTDLNVKTGNSPRFAFIALSGAMAARNILGIKQAFETQLKNSTSIVVDLSGVTLLDSMGVGIIVNFFRIVSGKRGRFAVICPESEAKEILEISDLGRLFPIYDSLAEAEEKFTSPS
jgi:anti-anti-sigma factor